MGVEKSFPPHFAQLLFGFSASSLLSLLVCRLICRIASYARALSRGNSDIFKFEQVAESCASSLFPVYNTTSRSDSGIQGGVAKDDLAKDDLLVDLSISDSNTSLPQTVLCP